MPDFGATSVTLQIFFSRYHLHATRMFRDQVAELEKSPFTLAHRSNCIACIVSATSFLEALVNEAYALKSGFGRAADDTSPKAASPEATKACRARAASGLPSYATSTGPAVAPPGGTATSGRGV